MDAHNAAVANIASSVRKFYVRKSPFRIYHGTTNSTRKSQFERSQLVDTSDLSNVLKIDTGNMTALVEPNVPMDCLVEATLLCGLIPQIVMEFPGITVGGGFAGTAGESSSFRYGLFEESINWIEMVLANGEIVNASRSVRPDLFCGSASSFGTLGVTTLLEIRLMQAKRFVELTYHPVSGISEALHKIEDSTNDPSIDYLDGIMYSQGKGVIISGRLRNYVDHGIKIQRFTQRTDPWFYLHAKMLMKSKTSPMKEAVPIVDYFFRYDRGAFWAARYSFKYFITPFNRITRFILDDFMHTRVLFHSLHQSGLAGQNIAQDVAIPYPKAEAFMQYLHISFSAYPIWLCPLKLSGKHAEGISAGKTNKPMPDMMLNFGVWGPGPRNGDEFVLWNRQFERKVHEMGGLKCLYAHAYYTEEEFYEIYNRNLYDALREKYHAKYLPSVYDKVTIDTEKDKRARQESWKLRQKALFWSIWPVAGLYGVYKVVRGGAYLLSAAPKGGVGGEPQVEGEMELLDD
jgi:Delta24-sterol reductase